MAYTVRQVAGLSGVSVRTLHFYDELGILKPAAVGASGYRYYEEPQLLMLQQILFYWELGFELGEIKRIPGRTDFEKAAALESHRSLLERKVTRIQTLIATIDKTVEHMRGEKTLRGEPIDCRVSVQDTGGEMCVFGWTGLSSGLDGCTLIRTSGFTSSTAS